MKISKLLSKFFTIFFLIFYITKSTSEEKPVDIWNLDKKDVNDGKIIKTLNNDQNTNSNAEIKIYETQPVDSIGVVNLEENISSQKVKIIGLYDPEFNGLNINMWQNTDGDQLKRIFKNLDKMTLSQDAKEILNITLLTNAYYPNNKISTDEFLKIKSKWLMKNSDLDLLENYVISNQLVNENPELVKYLVDQYLSQSNLEKSCKIFDQITNQINDEYLSKFKIYCLINNGKTEEAQLIFDLKKETGFKDKYFENKIDFLFGFNDKVEKKISKNSILDFHLAHKTVSNFSYEPNKSTPKLIWKYLSTSNLLSNVDEIDINELEKISIIEKATHDKNYSEKELFEIYKRFQFNIDQLLNIKDSHKLLSNIESRALIYQGILLTTDPIKKVELLKMLKSSFEKEKIGNAFDEELKNFLIKMDIDEIPSNYTDFFVMNSKTIESVKKTIKYNNKVLHQSKLIKYFDDDYSKNFKKDVNDFLKKIKKIKNIFFQKKILFF